MTYDQRYFEYLDHFGPTSTVREFAEHPEAANMVALRHDVDHDLDLALDMAFHEFRHGRRATYYLLHTHEYCRDPAFDAKVLQLVDYGHEVGLHLNALTPWIEGRTDTPIDDLRRWIDHVRSLGVDLIGSAAHGDAACYEHHYVNYWIWSELRPEDPMATEDSMSAEGIGVADDDRRVSYPPTHELRRADGDRFPLWSVSMRDLGLEYEAVKVPSERYWTDSGGGWTRSGDPLHADLSRGRHQVLVHPLWWEAPRRHVLAVTRTPELAEVLAQLAERSTSARVIPGPEASRETESAPDRGAPGAADDLRRSDVLGWRSRCLTAVRQQRRTGLTVSATLLGHAPLPSTDAHVEGPLPWRTLVLDDGADDDPHLARVRDALAADDVVPIGGDRSRSPADLLADLGLVVHPRLLPESTATATTTASADASEATEPTDRDRSIPSKLIARPSAATIGTPALHRAVRSQLTGRLRWVETPWVGCRMEPADGPGCWRTTGGHPTYLLAGEGRWSRMDVQSIQRGHPAVVWSFRASIDTELPLRVWVLEYDHGGRDVDQWILARISGDQPVRSTFTVPSTDRWFTIALHAGDAEPGRTVRLRRIDLRPRRASRGDTPRGSYGPRRRLPVG